MNDYVGKICPYCKCKFEENDEVVVCSDCEMPHHKDCWIENQGCTTFGCSGTIQGIDAIEPIEPVSGATEQVRTIYCSQCGEPSASNALFCSKCGSRLMDNTPPTPPVTPVVSTYNTYNTYNDYNTYNAYNNQNVTYEATANEIDDDVFRLIGNNKGYYLPRFVEFEHQNKVASWNWAAFLLGPFWLIYRKMYKYGYLMFAALVLCGVSDALRILLMPFIISGHVVWGIFANRVYKAQLGEKARQMKHITEPYKTEAIQRNCGVNVPAPILTAVGYFFFLIIASA